MASTSENPVDDAQPRDKRLLSLVIPVYNEAQHLERFFDTLFAVKFPCEVEFVVVDDHSRDASWDLIQKIAGSRRDLQIFRQPINSGKGAALHKGFELAKGDFIGIQDADFEYDPQDLVALVKPLLADKADVVYGSRFTKMSPQVHRTFHYLINRVLTLLSNVLSGLYLTDMETCYKIFKAEVLKNLTLESQRFGFEPEVTAKISKLKIRVLEFPIFYFPRSYIEGKKITWKDGLAAVWFIIKYNIRDLDRQALEKIPAQYRVAGRQWL